MHLSETDILIFTLLHVSNPRVHLQEDGLPEDGPSFSKHVEDNVKFKI